MKLTAITKTAEALAKNKDAGMITGYICIGVGLAIFDTGIIRVCSK